MYRREIASMHNKGFVGKNKKLHRELVLERGVSDVVSKPAEACFLYAGTDTKYLYVY
jgi:hypothetical protein